jgi:hypothetical protein
MRRAAERETGRHEMPDVRHHYVPPNTTRSIGFAAALHPAASTPERNGRSE